MFVSQMSKFMIDNMIADRDRKSNQLPVQRDIISFTLTVFALIDFDDNLSYV